MRGLIVTNSFSYSKSTEYKVDRLKEEFQHCNTSLVVKTGVDLPVKYKSGNLELDLAKDFDFCIYLDKDRYLATAINDLMPTFNSAKSIQICDDKMETFMALRGRNIKTPLTIPSPLNYSGNPGVRSKEIFLKEVADSLGFPMIVKQCYGSLGKQVHLINNLLELDAVYDLLYPYPHLYQEYLGKYFGTDYRVLTVGGKVVAAMKRVNETDFRSNIALGGRGYNTILPPEYVEMAEQVSEIIGLDYCGVDILVGDQDEPVLAEVNSNAFFTEIEKITETNVTKLLVDHILAKL